MIAKSTIQWSYNYIQLAQPRDDEAVYWVNIGHFEAAAVGN